MVVRAEPWPEAEALFHSDPRWLGGDGAYSVDLGGGRMLWLFGDSFIATSERHIRTEARLIRNSVAIQTGYDPSKARLNFAWRESSGLPQSFFPETGDHWYWPGDGVLIDDTLTVFLMEIRSSTGGLGFETVGWRAIRIVNPKDPPARWKTTWLQTPESFHNIILSATVERFGDHVVAYGVDEPGHRGFLCRWPLAAFRSGDLTDPEWYVGGAEGWAARHTLDRLPQPLFDNGQTEFSAHLEPHLNQWFLVQVTGFGAADLAYRTAPSFSGAWSGLESFYKPDPSGIPQVFYYAAKAHPHLTGADLVITYASNTLDFDVLLHNDRLYYPHVLRLTFSSEADSSGDR